MMITLALPLIEACPNEQLATVQTKLEDIFRRYGMPLAIYCDNGNAWGAGVPKPVDALAGLACEAWHEFIHSRPYHPQGRGKNERFPLSLKSEVTNFATLSDQKHAQKAFDRWREIYNHHRQREAIGMAASAFDLKITRQPQTGDRPRSTQTGKIHSAGSLGS